MAIVLWSVLFVRAPIPQQDPPVARPVVEVEPELVEEISASPIVEVEPTPLYTRRPKVGEKIGTITLESLNLSWPIFEGTEEAQLALGVGHYVQSVLPGVADNTVLAGHRNTVFNRLGELKAEDLILIKTDAGVFTYQVQSFRVVPRTDRTVIVPTEGAWLTLSTCYPFNNIGSTTDAFIVSAVLIDSVRSD